MQENEQKVLDHAEAARQRLEDADWEFSRCNIGLTSEKLWEAASSALKAVCECRGWQHDEYGDLREAIERLVKETGDDSLYLGFRIAYDGQLFVGSMDEQDVDTDRPIVRRLVNELLTAAGITSQ